jgi:hypothetical protein
MTKVVYVENVKVARRLGSKASKSKHKMSKHTGVRLGLVWFLNARDKARRKWRQIHPHL